MGKADRNAMEPDAGKAGDAAGADAAGAAPRQWITWKLGRDSGISANRRANHFLLYGVPALNILAIAALAAVATGRIAVSPSVRFDLPESEFFSGAHTALSAALVVPQGSGPILFFDGIRYRLDDETETSALAQALAGAVRETGTAEVSLFADETAPHGQIMRFAAAAKRAGVATVNVAVKEAPGK